MHAPKALGNRSELHFRSVGEMGLNEMDTGLLNGHFLDYNLLRLAVIEETRNA